MEPNGLQILFEHIWTQIAHMFVLRNVLKPGVPADFEDPLPTQICFENGSPIVEESSSPSPLRGLLLYFSLASASRTVKVSLELTNTREAMLHGLHHEVADTVLH